MDEWSTRLLTGCDALQLEAITCSDTPLLVLAGAGSGKTRVLTRRIAWRIARGDAAPAHVLALTFTRKAAAELRDRLARLGLRAPITAGTFHAVALAQLRRRALERGEAAPRVLASRTELLAELLAPTRPAPRRDRSRPPSAARELTASLAHEIEWSKARRIGPHEYVAAARAAERAPLAPLEVVAETFARYEQEKRRRRLLDFDDLLVRLAELIGGDADAAALQRWQFRHFFVDELQDANAAQLALLEAWLGGRQDLCAVGDPRQSIYGWNGADPSAVAGFATRFRAARVIRLEANYRSTPQIVAFARAVLGGGPSAGEPSTAALRPDGPVPEISALPSDASEGASVATAIRRRCGPGQTWRNVAVLARTNAQLVLLAEALQAAGIPVRSAPGAAFLSRPAVVEALGWLPHSGGPAVVAAWIDDVVAAARSDEAPGTVTGYDLADGERATDLDLLVRLASDYLALDPTPGPDGFQAFLRCTLRAEPSASSTNAVDVTTFHRAKGLEWPIVFVTGLEAGLVPIARATTATAVAEERRLLYVALSRAEDELRCTWARTRSVGSRVLEREPSPWLRELQAAREQLLARENPSEQVVRSALAASRAALGAPPREAGDR
ncbi:MAG TPA: ATP-dependent helicase [Acidimicrobiales bacterium]|nr:ATP-dependent helicase [Acidimicrobiales bacterium]